MLLLITLNIFNKIILKKNYLTQCAGLRLVIIIAITNMRKQPKVNDFHEAKQTCTYVAVYAKQQHYDKSNFQMKLIK